MISCHLSQNTINHQAQQVCEISRAIAPPIGRMLQSADLSMLRRNTSRTIDGPSIVILLPGGAPFYGMQAGCGNEPWRRPLDLQREGTLKAEMPSDIVRHNTVVSAPWVATQPTPSPRIPCAFKKGASSLCERHNAPRPQERYLYCFGYHRSDETPTYSETTKMSPTLLLLCSGGTIAYRRTINRYLFVA